MTRIGHGWDIHRLIAGGPLRLGGIDIPFHCSLHGHSDGDVVLHAIADALLGAIAAGDIGTHFPDTDPQFRGIDSAKLLRQVVDLVAERGYEIGNVDVTILAQSPKLAPHVGPMRTRLAAILGVADEQTSVKAKTAEGIGTVGKEEAISAMAVAAVRKRPVGC